MDQAQFFNQTIQPFPPLLPVVGKGLQDGQDVVVDRQLAENRGLLRQIADAVSGPQIHGQVGDFPVIQEHLPLVRRSESHQDVKGGCLAGSVWPQEPDNLSLTDPESDVVHNPSALVGLDQVDRFQDLHPRLS
jgi:hypothetical protein